MKIVAIEPMVLRAPYGEMAAYWAEGFWGTRAGGEGRAPVIDQQRVADLTLWRHRARYSAHIETTLVRITTDEGIVGYGEAHAPIAPQVTATIINTLLAPLLLGENPLAIDRLWEKMYASMRIRGHHTGFMSEAMAGIDIALWDIAGKATGLPVHLLMGGDYHDRVRVYQSHLPVLDTDEMVALAQHHAQAGFFGIKISGGAGPEVDIRNVERIREGVGGEIALMLDAAGVYDVPTAARIGRALERNDVLFFEDPLPCEDHHGYAELCRTLDVAVAMGETETTRYQFARRLAEGGVDVVLPDVCRANGLTECRKIAMLADVYNARLCPHNSVCSAVHHAASLHLCAAIPNFLIYEFWSGYNPLLDIVTVPISPTQGYLTVPTGPGLGIEIDEDKLVRLIVRD
ncbi:MAG: mandelate racemase/muconate lactonizing enzyme family protein [Armatimonadota bacterium]|nr:mandelate racemase/muconate lactonizing enzyme family protein [Armatimonadota bacterium]